MIVKVNGKEQEFNSNQIGLIELLRQNNITKPELVSVQLNGAFVKRDSYQEAQVKESDEIEFLYFIGGGSIRQQINK